MDWKTTLEKIFLQYIPTRKSYSRNGNSSFCPGGQIRPLLVLFLLVTSFAKAQTTQVIVGDDCITFDSCPADQVICASETPEGFGAIVNWTTPIITQNCTGNGHQGNFQMLFELNENLLNRDCWEFNWISRVGGNGGHIKLFSGSDDLNIDKSFITTPYMVLKDGAETSFEVNYSKPPGNKENYTYTIQLFLVDENGVEYPSGDPIQVTKDQKTYTFYTQNPGDTGGVFRLKYVFDYTGDTPSNANTGDTLIAVDGILNDNEGCDAGIDFVVTGPSQGYYPVGSHDLQYVATYRSPNGEVKTKTCSFNITVVGMDLEFTGVTDSDCNGEGGSFTAVATGVNQSTDGPFTYSLDGVNFSEENQFSDLSPGTYEVSAKDPSGCIHSEEVIIGSSSDTENPTITCPADLMNVSSDSANCFASNVDLGTPVVADNCSATDALVVTNNAPATFPLGQTVVTWTVTDESGNQATCTQTVNVVDTTAPVAPQLADVTGECSATATVPTTTDNCGGTITGTTEDALTYTTQGTHVITWSFDDGNGNVITVDQNVIIAGLAAPVVAVVEQPSCTTTVGSFSVTTHEGLEYSIDGTTFNSDGIFADLVPGTYNVVARNQTGCTSESTEVVINVAPGTPNAPVVEEVIQADCTNPTGMVMFTLVEGVSYEMTTSEGTVVADEDEDGIFDLLEPGTYSFKAVSSEGCVSAATEVIINSPEVTEIETTSVDLCVDDDPWNLNDLLVGEVNPNGVWEDPMNTGAVTENMVDPSLLAVGEYTFNYVIDAGACSSTTPVTVLINDDCVVLPCEIDDVRNSISKAVTPNGDNINDRFMVGLGVDCGFVYDLKIFNRWGSLVYESTNYQNDWDGTASNSFTGDQLPAGTYYYILNIKESGFDPIQSYIYLGTK